MVGNFEVAIEFCQGGGFYQPTLFDFQPPRDLLHAQRHMGHPNLSSLSEKTRHCYPAYHRIGNGRESKYWGGTAWTDWKTGTYLYIRERERNWSPDMCNDSENVGIWKIEIILQKELFRNIQWQWFLYLGLRLRERIVWKIVIERSLKSFVKSVSGGNRTRNLKNVDTSYFAIKNYKGWLLTFGRE